MAPLISEIFFPPATFRLRPSADAVARGYAKVFVRKESGQISAITVPVPAGLNLILRCADRNLSAVTSEGDLKIEPLRWIDNTKATLRSEFTSISRSILRLSGCEIFAEGSRNKTRRFRKQIEMGRRWGLSFDGNILQRHPELLEGWNSGTSPISLPAAVVDPGLKIAVAVHLYYTDLWPEIEFLLHGWLFSFTLFLSLPFENHELTARVVAAFPGARIRVVENFGRDVRPFLLMLEEGSFDSYDLVCKIHGKRSLGGGRIPIFGEIMRRAAFLDLIASRAQVMQIIELFRRRPEVGIVGPRRFLSASTSEAPVDVLGPSRSLVEYYARKMGSPLRGFEFDFFEGTMFWVRLRALEPIRRLKLSDDAFLPELGRLDGAPEHAVERMFNHSVRAAGYEVASADIDDA